MFLSSNWKALLKDSKQPRCEKSAKRKRRKGEESRSSAGGGSVLPAGSDSKDAGLTAVMAIDCEMVGVGRGGKRSMLARCSIVNFRGQVLYDKYVKPMEAVTDYRTEVSGIRPSHLNSDAAITFAQCQKEVASLLERRVLVGHSISNDLKSLLLSHPKHLVRDTAYYKKLCPSRPRALRKLVRERLGETIQTGEHSSVEDARSVLKVYKTVMSEWEKEIQIAGKGKKGFVGSKAALLAAAALSSKRRKQSKRSDRGAAAHARKKRRKKVDRGQN